MKQSAGDLVLYFAVSIAASIIGGIITAALVKKAIDDGLRDPVKRGVESIFR